MDKKLDEILRIISKLNNEYHYHAKRHDKDAAILTVYKIRYYEGYKDALIQIRLDNFHF